jgi:hypothetical protein
MPTEPKKTETSAAAALHSACNEIPAACSLYRAHRSALFERYLEYRATPSGTQVQYKLKLRPCAAATFLRPRLQIPKEFRFDNQPDDLIILHSGHTYPPDHAFAVPRDFTLLRDGVEVTDFSAPHVAALKVEDAIARTAEAAERLTELVGRIMAGARTSDLPVDTSALAVFLDRVPWTPFFYPEENRTFACPPPDATRSDLDAILAEEAPRLQAVLETAHRVGRALPAPKRRRNGSSRGRGRPVATDRDPDFDRRVYEAMQDGGTTYDDLARSWGREVEQLRLARDRHRKALEKTALKRHVK